MPKSSHLYPIFSLSFISVLYLLLTPYHNLPKSFSTDRNCLPAGIVYRLKCEILLSPWGRHATRAHYTRRSAMLDFGKTDLILSNGIDTLQAKIVTPHNGIHSLMDT